jgi:hypothetical protein
MRDFDGQKHWYIIRRLYCKACKKIHRELPAGMQPYKHYQIGLIEGALDGREPVCAADNSTLHRWKVWFLWAGRKMDACLIAIQLTINGLLQPLVGDQSPLTTRRGKGGFWLADSYSQTINAGYPAYTPSLHMAGG